MAGPVGEEEVRHVAALARLHLVPQRAAALAAELSGILAHMDALQAAPHAASAPSDATPTPERDDAGVPVTLARAREAFAPEMRDGFFLVPRLETHEEVDAP